MKVLFICTSGKDRSPALVEYFSENYPQHEYDCAGVNKYFCEKKGTHYISDIDILDADFLVFAEDIHLKVVINRFYNGSTIPLNKKYTVLNCGEYQQGHVGEDYLTKAEAKLQAILTAPEKPLFE